MKKYVAWDSQFPLKNLVNSKINMNFTFTYFSFLIIRYMTTIVVMVPLGLLKAWMGYRQDMLKSLHAYTTYIMNAASVQKMWQAWELKQNMISPNNDWLKENA